MFGLVGGDGAGAVAAYGDDLENLKVRVDGFGVKQLQHQCNCFRRTRSETHPISVSLRRPQIHRRALLEFLNHRKKLPQHQPHPHQPAQAPPTLRPPAPSAKPPKPLYISKLYIAPLLHLLKLPFAFLRDRPELLDRLRHLRQCLCLVVADIIQCRNRIGEGLF